MTKRGRFSIVTILVAASGWLVSLFLGILDLPAEINSFMDEAPEATQKVTDWLKLDKNYSGQWTSSLEGWVDGTEQEWALATANGGPIRMRLHIYDGLVEGEIESEGLKEGYVFNNLLLEGVKESDGLHVWAYDYISGEKRGLAELRLRLSDEVRLPLKMEVLQGGMGLPVKASLYRTSEDISAPISRQPNIQLLEGILEKGKASSQGDADSGQR